MSDCGPEKRSFERIETPDLERLASLAFTDLQSLFDRKPQLGAVYRNRLLALALCQGAALHFMGHDRGVNDFDVWAFFSSDPQRKFPYRRVGRCDFGPSKFGRHPDEPAYNGRRVDVIGRDIPSDAGDEAEHAILRYLRSRRGSAAIVAERPVILIHPPEKLGRVIWQPEAECAASSRSGFGVQIACPR